jgi:hypothetical protein
MIHLFHKKAHTIADAIACEDPVDGYGALHAILNLVVLQKLSLIMKSLLLKSYWAILKVYMQNLLVL